MRTLLVLTLLSFAALLVRAAPDSEPITCNENNGSVAAHKAMHHINENHRHGYKFRLHEVPTNEVEQVDDGCNIELHLHLLETTCHVTNPKPFEDCELREETEQVVMAECNVTINVRNGDAKIDKYQCDTQQVKSNAEMMKMCPDCPTLIPLSNTEGLKSVREAVAELNKKANTRHYFTLEEVGRITSGHMMMSGMNYHAEFVLVETHCPVNTRINPEACIPLCPGRAQHAFCNSSFSSNSGLSSVECEYYPAENTTALGPGEKEPVCRYHRHGHGPPPHAHNHSHGPPPHAHDHGHGPPPHSNDRGHGGPPHSNDRGHGGPPHSNDRGHGGPPHSNDRGHGGPPHSNDRGHGGPPHSNDRGHGGPPHAGRGGPPHSNDRGHGGPPHSNDHGHRPPFFSRKPCRGLLADPDPALHPICPWPLPEHHHRPKPHSAE